jgi:AAHS family 4-hydroxybenzoate transporter-like MFS transporter
MMSWLPTLLKEAHWSTTDALRGTAFLQLGGIFGSLLIAWAIDRRQLLLGLVGGYGCSALALLAIGLLPASVVGWQVLLLLVGAGISGIQGIWMSLAVGLYPLDLRATSGGGVAAISRIGAFSGPMAGSFALLLGIEPRLLLMALVAPIALSIVAIVFTRRHFVSPAPVTDAGLTQPAE